MQLMKQLNLHVYSMKRCEMVLAAADSGLESASLSQSNGGFGSLGLERQY